MSKFVTIPHTQWLELLSKISRIEESIVVMGAVRTKKSNEFISKLSAKSMLGIKSDKTLFKLRDEGKIQSTRVGKHYMYSLDSIQQFLKQNSTL